MVFTTTEDGWVMAQAPEFLGAVTQGRDLDEAGSMIQETVGLLLVS